MKNISNFEEFLILKEGINLDPSDIFGLKINIIRNSDNSNDDFIINRSGSYYKKMLRKIPVYYGFEPNPIKGFSESKISEIYNTIKVKDESKISYIEDLKKLVILTSPSSIPFNKIIIPQSGSVINFTVAKILAKKYGNIPESNIYTVPKLEYLPKDMVNRDKYEKSDPITKGIVDSWVKCVKNKKGETTPIHIKKSGYDGECGLQTGGRSLLNPVFAIPKIFSSRDKILIVDDFIITGTTIAEISKTLIEDGIPPENIYSYVLGVKKFSKEVEY